MVTELQKVFSKKQIILFLCASLLASQILDACSYAFFYLYVAPFSKANELNPIINFIASVGGTPAVVAIKLFVGYRIWRSATVLFDMKYRTTKIFVYTLLPLGAVVGLIGFIANTSSILGALR